MVVAITSTLTGVVSIRSWLLTLIGLFWSVSVSAPPSIVSNAGGPLGIATDYDGDARNGSTPDIGADEFSYLVITASAGPNGFSAGEVA